MLLWRGWMSNALGEVLVEFDHGQSVTFAVLPQVYLGLFRRLAGQVTAGHEREGCQRRVATPMARPSYDISGTKAGRTTFIDVPP
jgi:hypothetical protein